MFVNKVVVIIYRFYKMHSLPIVEEEENHLKKNQIKSKTILE